MKHISLRTIFSFALCASLLSGNLYAIVRQEKEEHATEHDVRFAQLQLEQIKEFSKMYNQKINTIKEKDKKYSEEKKQRNSLIPWTMGALGSFIASGCFYKLLDKGEPLSIAMAAVGAIITAGVTFVYAERSSTDLRHNIEFLQGVQIDLPEQLKKQIQLDIQNKKEVK